MSYAVKEDRFEGVVVRGSTEKSYAVSTNVMWRYDTPPENVKVFLLTIGGIAVEGIWSKGGGFIAWHPLFKRDKEIESRLGFL